MEKIIIIFIILLSYLAGAFSFAIYTQKNERAEFQAGWEAAKQRIENSGFYDDVEIGKSTQIKSVTGKIKQVENNKLFISILPISPLDEDALNERIVLVDQNTQIYKIKKKSDKEYNKELEKWLEENKEYLDRPDAPIAQPVMYYEELVNKESLKIGQSIAVEADENIRIKKQFKAQKIVIQL